MVAKKSKNVVTKAVKKKVEVKDVSTNKTVSKPKKDLKSKKASNDDIVIKSIEKDLIKDLHSTMFDSVVDRETVSMTRNTHEDMSRYFKKMVFKCKSCDHDFKHDTNLEPIVVELSCPGCNDKHTIHFTPASKLFHVYSSSLDVNPDD